MKKKKRGKEKKRINREKKKKKTIEQHFKNFFNMDKKIKDRQNTAAEEIKK